MTLIPNRTNDPQDIEEEYWHELDEIRRDVEADLGISREEVYAGMLVYMQACARLKRMKERGTKT